jgi:hypothetical protein
LELLPDSFLIEQMRVRARRVRSGRRKEGAKLATAVRSSGAFCLLLVPVSVSSDAQR